MSINLINVTNPKNLKETINSILQAQADLAGSIQGFDSKIPTLLSQLLNDVGFITNTVDNLINYYSKSDVNALLAAIKTFSAQIVTTLPTTNISTTTIYLVAAEDAVTNNYYNEYLYINNSWELIGTTKIDLSDYVRKDEVASYVTPDLRYLGDVYTIPGIPALNTEIQQNRSSMLFSREPKVGDIVEIPTLDGNNWPPDYSRVYLCQWKITKITDQYIWWTIVNQPVAHLYSRSITTTISADSTNKQVPSAKAVYDTIQSSLGDINTILDAINGEVV